VADALARQDTFCTAQQLHAWMRQAGTRIGLTTVYRALTALAETGEVDSLRTDAGELAYRRCLRGHHHHLICRACGRTVEVEGPPVEAWAADVAARAGYVDVTHTVEVFGTCGACAAGGSADS
jgi:Fur family ferric uptake transcriptional regulator